MLRFCSINCEFVPGDPQRFFSGIPIEQSMRLSKLRKS